MKHNTIFNTLMCGDVYFYQISNQDMYQNFLTELCFHNLGEKEIVHVRFEIQFIENSNVNSKLEKQSFTPEIAQFLKCLL